MLGGRSAGSHAGSHAGRLAPFHLSDDPSQVVATRMELQVPRYGARQMLALRRAIEASSLGLAAFAVSTFDIYVEQDAIMVPTTMRSLLLIGIAVLVAVGTCSSTLTL